jgi:flagellum-specific peptidoglycan hydrolase FlgJ
MLMNVHVLTDFPVSMIYSFFIIEATSQGVETELWRKHANAGGVKALKGYDHVTYKTREVIRGRNKYIMAKFMSAESTEEGMKLWAGVLNSGRYAACKKANYKMKGIKLYESICKCVYKSGYHTDTDYKFRASLMAEYWQIKRDNFPLKKDYNQF